MKKSEASRRRILDAAAKMFRDKGYAATTLNDIARLARMRAASIYYHFESKDSLFAEVMDIGIDRIHDQVRRAVAALPDGASHRRKVHTAIETHLATLLKHSDYTAANIINFGLAPAPIRRRHRGRREAYGDYWRELLGAAQAAGAIRPGVDLSLFRLFVIGALNWSQEWYRPKGKSIAELADDVTAMVFDGVAGEG
ncbi:MAG: TetR/AcrR family transcriptional regulator [Alphaproteobacteria bacterium]|jgi:AcrR family transcriptional regulator|nr:TetR/AcrR family transcriptional regulator [Alphaproteobacteria bacterium]MDP6814663.1 TetR/AcrR family transcriptional regulator [Alphaproteobacteria bacterium]